MNDRARTVLGIIGGAIGVSIIAAVAAVCLHDRELAMQQAQASISTVPRSTFEAVVDPDSESPTMERHIMYNGQEYQYREDIDTLLLIGTDDYEMSDIEMSNTLRNTSQSDFLLVVVFDNTNETYRIIQINRDTMTAIRKYDIYGQYEGLIILQIALSHTYGTGADDSCRDTEFAVSRLLYDSDIDYYMAITMSAVPILNDLVGGVDVVIEDNFEGVNDRFRVGETVHLEGDDALLFVRSRQSMPDDSTNIARMGRQRTYMLAFMEALGNAMQEDPDFEVRAFSALSDCMITDMSTDVIDMMAARFLEYDEEGIFVIEGEAVEGTTYMEFYPDEAALRQLIIDTFYEPV